MTSLLHEALRAPLARKAIIGAIQRWPGDRLRWWERYRRRIEATGRVQPGQTYFGARMACDIRDHIGARIFYFGIWEPSVSHCIEQNLRPGDTFVDVGANIGYDTLLGSGLVGPTGKVVAIEASPRIFGQLQENLSLNNVTNVRTVNKAASAMVGELQLYGGDEHNSGRTSGLAREGLVAETTVPMFPLDMILTVEERANVGLIKIDVEGGELPILERLIETLDLYPARLSLIIEMSPEDGGAPLADAFQKMLNAKFKAYAIENSYDIAGYLAPINPRAPVEVTALPDRQTDILFTRAA